MLSPEMAAQLQGTAASLQKAADGVATLTQQIAPAAGKLPATIDQLNRTLASTNQLITGLNRPNGPFETNLNKVGTAAQQAGDALASMNGDVAGAVVAGRLRHLAARQLARGRRALRGPLGGPRGGHVQHQSAQRAVRRAGLRRPVPARPASSGPPPAPRR